MRLIRSNRGGPAARGWPTPLEKAGGHDERTGMADNQAADGGVADDGKGEAPGEPDAAGPGGGEAGAGGARRIGGAMMAPAALKLSPREAQLLGLIWQGLSIKVAAVEMRVSEKWARNLRTMLFSKLGVHRQVSAVRRGLELGILRLDPHVDGY